MRVALGISRAKYDEFIAEGILPAPVALSKGSRPMHNEMHVRIAERNLDERMMRDWNEIQRKNAEKGYKPMKPVTGNCTNMRGKK